jgi:peptidoglycan hydrolase CwlO-like protein
LEELEAAISSDGEEKSLAQVQLRVDALREKLSSSAFGELSSSPIDDKKEKLSLSNARVDENPLSTSVFARSVLQAWRSRSATAEQLQRRLIQFERQQSDIERAIERMRKESTQLQKLSVQMERQKKSASALLEDLRTTHSEASLLESKRSANLEKLLTARKQLEHLQKQLEFAKNEAEKEQRSVSQAEGRYEQHKQRLASLQSEVTEGNSRIVVQS